MYSIDCTPAAYYDALRYPVLRRILDDALASARAHPGLPDDVRAALDEAEARADSLRGCREPTCEVCTGAPEFPPEHADVDLRKAYEGLEVALALSPSNGWSADGLHRLVVASGASARAAQLATWCAISRGVLEQRGSALRATCRPD